MPKKYRLSGMGYILKDGVVLENQTMKSPQDVVVALLNEQHSRIVELEEVERKANALYNSIGTHSSGRKWVNQGPVDDPQNQVICETI